MARKSLPMWCAVLAILVQTGCAPSPLSELGVAEPEEIGLTWQECPDRAHEWEEAENCFGHPMPLWEEGEYGNFARRLADGESLELTIGRDVYRAVPRGHLLTQQRYTLYRNGRAVKSLYGTLTAYSPNVSLQNVGGKAVWEFSDGKTVTIIYDGKDVRDLYQLEKAYRPYGLGDRLIFIGQKDGKYFVIYDGRKVGPDFDLVHIAYCCEPVLWSVQCGHGKYLFWGNREGQQYVVEISLREE